MHTYLLLPQFFFNCGSQFFRLSLKDGLIEFVSEVIWNEEKANTKVFLCTKHSEALGVSVACISIVDSYIAIYALYFTLKISIPMYIEIGTSNQRRCIAIRNVAGEIIAEVCLVFPAFYSFTGTAPFTETVKMQDTR